MNKKLGQATLSHGGGTGEGKKCLSFGKFGVLYFLVTLALRLTLLPTNYALSSIHLNR